MFSLVVAIVFIFLTSGNSQIPWAVRLLPLLLVLTGDSFAWLVIRPPVLRADALEVRVINPLYGKRMQRSAVASVYRGQYFQQGRAGGTWEKGYIFAEADGKIGVTCAASWFSDDGMTEFAARLGVPLRGDFTERYRGDEGSKP